MSFFSAQLLTTTKNLNKCIFYNNQSDCGHEGKANGYVNEGNNDGSNKVDSTDNESGGKKKGGSGAVYLLEMPNLL